MTACLALHDDRVGAGGEDRALALKPEPRRVGPDLGGEVLAEPIDGDCTRAAIGSFAVETPQQPVSEEAVAMVAMLPGDLIGPRGAERDDVEARGVVDQAGVE